MYLKERLAFFAIVLTIPDSMHMWLKHDGQPFKKVWAVEPLHWVLYDVFTLSVFTMALFFIAYFAIRINFHKQFEHWEYQSKLKRYLKQSSVTLQLFYNAKQTGFDPKVFQGKGVEKFRIQAGQDSSQVQQEITEYFQQLNGSTVSIEPGEAKFQVIVRFDWLDRG